MVAILESLKLRPEAARASMQLKILDYSEKITLKIKYIKINMITSLLVQPPLPPGDQIVITRPPPQPIAADVI